MTLEKKVAVIGAGLAGCECAWILAEHYSISVTLFEMKPKKVTPAQSSPHLFAELVCSNSLKSKSRLNPAGTLKNEIVKLGSLIIPTAKEFEVPAGETLAVDRELFSGAITHKLKTHKYINVIECAVESIDEIFTIFPYEAVVIATGPLTDETFAQWLKNFTSSEHLYFYDAIAPIIDADSIDYNIAFRANRKTKTHAFEKRLKESQFANQEVIQNLESTEEGDYLNLPLNKEEYFSFVTKIQEGSKVPHHAFEEARYFNGCQPIEVLAERGDRTLAFGPMKARGLTDPRTGRWPYAVVQLRKEKLSENAWNMVGFQTRLTWTDQKNIFKTLPALKDAEFFRMGSMHRNTYMLSPSILNSNFSFKKDPRLYLAGQIMGVEGYLESAAMGVFIAHAIGYKLTRQKILLCPPADTSLGGLARYCIETDPKYFTPMNIHWGLFSELTNEDIQKYNINSLTINTKKLDKSLKRELLSNRSEALFNNWLKEIS